MQLSNGFHDVRVEYFELVALAKIKLHWDKIPPPPQFTPQNAIVDVFLVTAQDVCIAGDPYSGTGAAVSINNPDNTPYRSWQYTPGQSPVALKTSDPSLPTYAQVECFQFRLGSQEIADANNEIAKFAADIQSWTRGALMLTTRVHQVSGEMRLANWDDKFFIDSWNIAEFAQPFVTRDTDYTITISSNHDIAGRYYSQATCGATRGADAGVWGAGHSWIPNSVGAGYAAQCMFANVISNEWAHQHNFAVTGLLGLESIYPPYPPCGQGDPDTYKWYPSHYVANVDPSSPWCGGPLPGTAPQLASNLLWHYDPSLAHYPLGFFTGNHCSDGKQNIWPNDPNSETGIDTGGNCPP